MKAKELDNYRDKDGYIDYTKFETEKGNSLETIDEDRGSGSRDKKWVVFEDTRVMLRNDQFEKDGSKYTTYQELIFEELAKQVNFPTAHYDLIKRDNKKGVITYNIVDEDENKGLSMYSLGDIMSEAGFEDLDFDYNITDAYSAIKNFCKNMEIEKEQYSETMVNFTKMQVLDLFLSSTDRHPGNISFLYGVDEKTKKRVFKFAPLYDNELSCGSDLREEDMEDSITDFRKAKTNSELQITCASVPREKMPPELLKSKDNNPNSQLLKFCMDIDEEVEDFAGECMDNLNIIQAVRNVEDRIQAKIPEKYVEFLLANYSEKKKEMSRIMDEFYQII